ncbi:MAG: acetate--CoA ligase family protein [Gammaproteobacteria bacterium]|nr:acetate--CoA ligase family protein [Gammaproteobacteria bacterium]
MPDGQRLTRLLRPRHIAAIGGRYAEEVVRQCQQIGFRGPLWPVNPGRPTMQALPCFANLADLPQAPDAAFVGVAREDTIDVVAELARGGCGGVVVLASGFAELDEAGRQMQQALVEAAGDMPLVGPNCYGLLNYLDGAALWPDQHGGERSDRGVALITQSGNIGISLTMQQRSLPIAYVVSVGNQAVLSVGDYIEAFVDDPRVTAIGLHLEGVRDVERFAIACAYALAKCKPVVVLKSGRSGKAAQAALSHTSSLTGTDDLYSALFERYGAARVTSLSSLIETLKLLHVHGVLPGNRIASMSCSGGEAGLVADLAQELNLQMPAFSSEQSRVLHEVLGERVAVDNPLDYHTYIWADRKALTDCYSAVLASDVDVAMLIDDYPNPDRCDDHDWLIAERAFIDAYRRAGNRPVVVATIPENFPRSARERFLAAGIAPMQGLDDSLAAIKAAVSIGAAHARPTSAPLLAPCAPLTGDSRVLDEHAAKAALQEAGISIPAGRRASRGTAAAAAEQLGFPVAVKALGESLAHKTEAGALRLNVTDPTAVTHAVRDMRDLGAEILVERMIDNVVAELLIGVVRDAQFGPTLVIGSGGVRVELLADSAALLLPTNADEVLQGLRGLRNFPLLEGFRGAPAGDIDAVVVTVLRVADYAIAHRHDLLELDINPLLVLPRGEGTVAADAFIRISLPSPSGRGIGGEGSHSLKK